MLGLNLGLGVYRGQQSLTARAISTLRRLGATVIGISDNFVGTYIDSTGTTPVTAVGDVIGRVNDRIGSNHATQATTASKPLAGINAQGKKVISFDGSNDFLQTSITTGNEGWFCAGVTFGGAVGANETVFATGAGSAAMKGVWFLRNGSTNMRLNIGNGTSLTQPVVNAFTLIGVPRVVDAGWSAATAFAAVDGTESSQARTGDATVATAALIGTYASGVHALNGPMTCAVISPVLPSATDRALIRKWIGSLQGQTL